MLCVTKPRRSHSDRQLADCSKLAIDSVFRVGDRLRNQKFM
jgi:hypothetical protein